MHKSVRGHKACKVQTLIQQKSVIIKQYNILSLEEIVVETIENNKKHKTQQNQNIAHADIFVQTKAS